MPNLAILLSRLAALVLCAGACQAQVVITTNRLIGPHDATLDGQDVIVEGCVLTVDGPQTFRSLIIRANAQNVWGMLTHPAGPASLRGLDLTIVGDVFLEGPGPGRLASRIDVSGCGWRTWGGGPGGGPAGFGPCQPNGAGGHGGPGAEQTATYGDFLGPVTFGSSGGAMCQTEYSSGGAGGGAVKIVAGGHMNLQGVVAANGSDGWGDRPSMSASGGAGGSIWLVADQLSVATVRANGGRGVNDVGRSGGGGRILLEYGTSLSAPIPPEARGGDHADPSRRGGAGVRVVRQAGSPVLDEVGVDNGAVDTPTYTPLNDLWTPAGRHLGALRISNGAAASIPRRLSDNDLVQRFLVLNDYDNQGVLLSRCRVSMESLAIAGAPTLCQIVGATITHPSGSPYHQLTVAGGMTLRDTTFAMAGLARGAATGPGQGQWPGVGGGFGGQGGQSGNDPGGASYPLAVNTRFALGSDAGPPGGPNGIPGAGGGAINISCTGRLDVSGITSLIVSGADACCSTHNPMGGGSGGSIRLSAGELVNHGTLRLYSKGGDAEFGGGGGGGGRVELLVNLPTQPGTVDLQAPGGRSSGGAECQGGAGTIRYVHGRRPITNIIDGEYIIDNGGVMTSRRTTGNPGGAGYTFRVRGGALFDRTLDGNTSLLEPWDLEVSGQSRLNVSGAIQAGAVDVTGASLIYGTAMSTLSLNARSLLVDATSAISMYGLGYGPGMGPGAGGSSNCGAASGASHGGLGGGSPLRDVYDDPENPVLPGSGGGGVPCNVSYPGPGGGVLLIRCSQGAQIDGIVDASGATAYDGSAGGASGGSIQLSTPTLTGSGRVSASGGSGVGGRFGFGGGGGGGRIKYSFCDSGSFSGTFRVDGGGSPGPDLGQPGTFFAQSQNFTVTDQPSPAFCSVQGHLVVMGVTTTGWTQLTYQWSREGMPLADGDNVSGAQGPVLTLTPARLESAGTYTCTISSGLCEYTTSPSVLTVVSSPADFNGDGFLDFFDYDDYVLCYETGVCPDGKTADFNGDDFADFFDYDDFVAAFEAGC